MVNFFLNVYMGGQELRYKIKSTMENMEGMEKNFISSLARAKGFYHGGTEGMEEKLYAAWLGRLLATKNTKGTKTTEARIPKPERSEGLVSLGC